MAARIWTQEQKQRQREAIQRWKPWTQSTGPRTEAGKQTSARNGDTGGRGAALRALKKEVSALLREQKQTLKRA